MNQPMPISRQVAITCPHPGCEANYRCEACINEHFVGQHGMRYGDVFGPQDLGFVNFCRSHEQLTASVLGI